MYTHTHNYIEKSVNLQYFVVFSEYIYMYTYILRLYIEGFNTMLSGDMIKSMIYILNILCGSKVIRRYVFLYVVVGKIV